MCPPLGMAQDLCTSFEVKEKPVFSFQPCGSLAQESVILASKGGGLPSIGLVPVCRCPAILPCG